MVISVQAEKPPVKVNSSPSLRTAEKPVLEEMAAVGGKVPSSSPYGKFPCVLKFFPSERYWKVRVCGLLVLKLLEQIRQSPSRGRSEAVPLLLSLPFVPLPSPLLDLEDLPFFDLADFAVCLLLFGVFGAFAGAAAGGLLLVFPDFDSTECPGRNTASSPTATQTKLRARRVRKIVLDANIVRFGLVVGCLFGRVIWGGGCIGVWGRCGVR